LFTLLLINCFLPVSYICLCFCRNSRWSTESTAFWFTSWCSNSAVKYREKACSTLCQRRHESLVWLQGQERCSITCTDACLFDS